jgi:hypothetical protein
MLAASTVGAAMVVEAGTENFSPDASRIFDLPQFQQLRFIPE